MSIMKIKLLIFIIFLFPTKEELSEKVNYRTTSNNIHIKNIKEDEFLFSNDKDVLIYYPKQSYLKPVFSVNGIEKIKILYGYYNKKGQLFIWCVITKDPTETSAFLKGFIYTEGIRYNNHIYSMNLSGEASKETRFGVTGDGNAIILSKDLSGKFYVRVATVDAFSKIYFSSTITFDDDYKYCEIKGAGSNDGSNDVYIICNKNNNYIVIEKMSYSYSIYPSLGLIRKSSKTLESDTSSESRGIGVEIIEEKGLIFIFYGTGSYAINGVIFDIFNREIKVKSKKIVSFGGSSDKFTSKLNENYVVFGFKIDDTYIQIMDINGKALDNPIILPERFKYAFDYYSDFQLLLIEIFNGDESVSSGGEVAYYSLYQEVMKFGFNDETGKDSGNINYPYFYSSSKNKYINCRSDRCNLCSNKIDANNHYCITCKDEYYPVKSSFCYRGDEEVEGYVFNFSLKKFEKCDYYFYRDDKDKKVCSPRTDEYPYLIKDTLQITDECPNLLMPFENVCVDRCENGYKKTNKNTCEKFERNDSGRAKSNDSLEKIGEHIEKYVDGLVGEIIQGDHFTYDIYTTDSKTKETPNDISIIDLGKCEKKIKEHYKLPEEEPLIIVKLDTKTKDSPSPSVSFEVYSLNGTKLDKEVCKEKIKVFPPILNPEKVSLDKGKSFSEEKGVDIYNPKDPFFSSICIDYFDDKGDVTIKDRRKYYFINTSFCELGCKYVGINYTTNRATCQCSFDQKETHDNEFIPFGTSLLESTNFILFSCYNQVITSKVFYCIGFYFMISILGIQFLCLIILNGFEMKKVTMKLCNTFTTKRKKNKDDSDITSLPFEQATLRGPSILSYFSFFLQKIDILKIIIFPSAYQYYSLSISGYFFTLGTKFMVNGLLYSDDVISKKYSDNKTKYTDLILSICSNIIGFIISSIITRLINFDIVFKLLAQTDNREISFFNKFTKLAQIAKIKIVLFYNMIFVFGFCYLYFLCCFNNIYHKSQWSWFYNGLMGIIISLISSLAKAALSIIIRAVSICIKSKFIYNLFLYMNK